MANERNALAELANELSWIEDILRDEGYGAYCDEANKARRIIAELAKVEYVTDCDGNKIYLPAQASQAISKCRAIAEEGENHD